jgi:hypothetical protein
VGGSGSDGVAEEGREVGEQLSLVHAKVEVEEEEELTLHEIHFGAGEEGGVSSPVLVLGRRVWQRGNSQSQRVGHREGLGRRVIPFKYFAATINVARKTRWRVQCIPFATLGRRVLRRSRYTRVQRRVGTWTLDFSTRMLMKVSSEGMGEFVSRVEGKLLLVGVAGGEGRQADGGGPHWMTSTAFSAMYAEENKNNASAGRPRKPALERVRRTDHLWGDWSPHELQQSWVVHELWDQRRRVSAS